MTRRGRPPKSVGELKATGAYRPDRHRHRGRLTLPPADARKPAWLTGAEATALWRRVAPQLSKVGILSELDKDTLAMACFLYGEARRTAADLRRARDDGQRRKLTLILKALWGEASTLFGKFGLTPSDRAGLGVTVSHAEESDRDAQARKFGILG